MNGVVPVVDLGRVYALIGPLDAGQHARPARGGGRRRASSRPSGARDLIDAYDMIAASGLRTRRGPIQRGARPDNFMAPSDLSDFERSHLRDAFVVVRTMQSALGHARGAQAEGPAAWHLN